MYYPDLFEVTYKAETEFKARENLLEAVERDLEHKEYNAYICILVRKQAVTQLQHDRADRILRELFVRWLRRIGVDTSLIRHRTLHPISIARAYWKHKGYAELAHAVWRRDLWRFMKDNWEIVEKDLDIRW